MAGSWRHTSAKSRLVIGSVFVNDRRGLGRGVFFRFDLGGTGHSTPSVQIEYDNQKNLLKAVRQLVR